MAKISVNRKLYETNADPSTLLLWVLRDELVRSTRITREEVALLQHEALGHGSKVIAAELHTEATTIDCRFQRLNAKLGAPNRRAALRIARLYGLL